MFRITEIGEVEESFINDPFMADEFEELPGGWLIEYRELGKARKNEKFRVKNHSGDWLDIEPDWNGFAYYFDIWENFHYFGLPNGKGWAQEQSWVIEFLKSFQRVFNSIEAFRVKKSSASKG